MKPNAEAPEALDPRALPGIRHAVVAWYGNHSRVLPWRAADRSPWGVLVSEIMLQQTPVVRVLPVWRRWMQRWPHPGDLAAAAPADVVRAWDRLGYPRRALRLHAAAQRIRDEHHGVVPEDHAQLLALPGIGTYTAAAVAVFAFGQRHTVVDTNIRRVEARLFSGRALPGRSLTAAETRLADAVLPADVAESVAWNQAVMELGALVCTARAPRCEECPVAHECAWVAAGSPPAEEVPRAQAWHGTDRQVRGAIMAVLRAAEEPVAKPLLLADAASSEQLATEHAAPPEVVVERLTALWRLSAPLEQRERALTGLVLDGLAAEGRDGVSLPG
ncbi:A/G-specific adenine glycosylase [Kocuria sp.]|uniref:A/G-specific adenine glycosylase n=1 Tax=Kocuria sp. TaxID=1871328 RepID=UPI0026DBBC46|nr:A/G-specific adenine glycosylase [Kocuria sp.]MDO4919218.1 A/G-specific adenine glycosylase [Kocuria sp.]